MRKAHERTNSEKNTTDVLVLKPMKAQLLKK